MYCIFTRMPDNYHNIYILGAHKLATSCYKKLLQAQKDGHLEFKNIYLIDPDKNCYFSTEFAPSLPHSHAPSPLITKTYPQFILNYVEGQNNYNEKDILIPDHTAKHVFLQVYLQIVKQKFPKLTTELSPFKSDFKPPFIHKSENDAIWAISYATWICPPDCDEPEICPHIEDTRTWDFNESLGKLFDQILNQESTRRLSTQSIHRFPCTQLYAEIAQIPFPKIIKEISEFIYKLQNDPPQKVIVATHSHCHGILGQFEIKPRASVPEPVRQKITKRDYP